MTTKETLVDIRKKFSNTQFAFFWILFILAILLGIGIPIIIPNSMLQNIKLSKNYKAGELADEDVYAPASVSFVDEVATQEKRREVAASIYPFYSYNVSSTLQSISNLNAYMDAILGKGAGSPYSALDKFDITDEKDVTGRILALSSDKRNLTTRLVRENLERILRQGLYALSDVNLSIGTGYPVVTSEVTVGDSYELSTEEIDLSEVLTDADLYEYLVQTGLMSYPNLGFDNILLIADATMLFARPNVRYNEIKTMQLREEAAAKAGNVVVRVEKGELIIGRDTIITEQQLRTIDRINEIRVDTNIMALVGQALFILAILVLGIGIMFYYVPYKFRIPLYVLMFLGIFDLTIILSYFSMLIVSNLSMNVALDTMLPYFFLPVFFTCVTNKKRIGFTIGFMFAGFAVVFPTSSKFSFFYLLATIEMSVLFVRFGTNRIDTLYQVLYTVASTAVITAIFCSISDYTTMVSLNSILAAVVNVIFAYIFVSVLLPVVELVFNIPTNFRLHELSYTDTPTLNRLNQVAQGTFNHVRNVSDMAYSAAKEIGANAELARVGALYHDIGKAEHPEYFIENQNGKNIHDQINTNLSAAVIKSHVKLGVEKGREIGLPQEVLNIISEHHGNDIITFFYNEAKKDAAGRANVLVSEEDFRYNGQIPQTPESGIVMLADCVEAASRTLKNPNTQKYDRLIMNIIISKINHNQLSDSQLTLTDLITIKDTFIRSLVGRDHQRIEYDN